MKREGHDNVTFFIGPEVEHTPAFSKKTLFVVGKQDLATIESIARTHKIQHIFMGANHSFEVDPTDNTFYWSNTITALLDKGFWVTLDYPAHEHHMVLPMFSAGVWQSRQFIPMLRVCISKLHESSANLVVKFDDIDFKATNPGVWVWHHHELADSNKFTDWIDYGTDVVIKKVVELQPSDVTPKKKVVANTTSVAASKSNSVVIDTNPMGLDVDAPSALNQVEIKAADVAVVKNDSALGLDPDSPSKLKPEDKESSPFLGSVPIAKTPNALAEAYAEGSKEDPLGKLSSKKSKVNKKTAV